MALEETVAHFMAALLTFTRAITEEGAQRLQADRDQLVAFFQQHCKPDRVVKLAAPLQDLKDVAAADSVDTFVLTYTTLLQVRWEWLAYKQNHAKPVAQPGCGERRVPVGLVFIYVVVDWL